MRWDRWDGRVCLSACGRYRIAVHGNKHYAQVFAGYRRDARAALQSLGRFDQGDAQANIEAARQACAAHAAGGGSGGRHG